MSDRLSFLVDAVERMRGEPFIGGPAERTAGAIGYATAIFMKLDRYGVQGADELEQILHREYARGDIGIPVDRLFPDRS